MSMPYLEEVPPGSGSGSGRARVPGPCSGTSSKSGVYWPSSANEAQISDRSSLPHHGVDTASARYRTAISQRQKLPGRRHTCPT